MYSGCTMLHVRGGSTGAGPEPRPGRHALRAADHYIPDMPSSRIALNKSSESELSRQNPSSNRLPQPTGTPGQANEPPEINYFVRERAASFRHLTSC